MYHVEFNGEKHPVQFSHCWPDRVKAEGHIPHRGLRLFTQHKSKYLSLCVIPMTNTDLTSFAVLRSDDNGSRKAGAFIAFLRMARALKVLGLKIERNKPKK